MQSHFMLKSRPSLSAICECHVAESLLPFFWLLTFWVSEALDWPVHLLPEAVQFLFPDNHEVQIAALQVMETSAGPESCIAKETKLGIVCEVWIRFRGDLPETGVGKRGKVAQSAFETIKEHEAAHVL